jgi:beta-lactamase class C
MQAIWGTPRGRMLVLLLGILLIAATLAVATSFARREDSPAPETALSLPAVRQPTRVDYQQLDARIQQLMQSPDMVGLAVGTIENGEVSFVRGYGETLAGSGVPVTPATVFRWASLSKGVGAALVAGLAADGKLSLDAPITSLRTTLTVPGDARKVTVADVLSHRLGLVRNAWDERLEAGEDPRMLRSTLGTLPPLCPPASCYAYQNIGFDAATEIVEQVTKQDYATAARTRLFAPLGMASASIGRAALQSADSWAQPHRLGKLPTTVTDIYYRIPAAGGVNSSIRDLLRWMQAQTGAAPGVLSAATLETLHRRRVATPPTRRRGAVDRALTDAAYGLGWRSYVYAGHALVGHRGSVDGYRSLILFDPAANAGIVMLWNSNYGKAGGLQLEFFDLLYGLPATDWLELAVNPAPTACPEGDHSRCEASKTVSPMPKPAAPAPRQR